MFIETNHNRNYYTAQMPLPCILNSLCDHYLQEDIHCPHGRGIHQFIWVEEGTMRLTVGGQEHSLTPGKGVFIRAHTPHAYTKCGNTPPTTAWFSFIGLDGVLDFYEAKPWFLFDVPAFLPTACRQLDARCQKESDPIQRSIEAYSLANELLSNLLSDQFSLVHQVNHFLENHFSEPLTLDDIAETVKINRYTLCHRYAKDCSASIMETLQNIRIAKAKQYLLTTSLPIAHISSICGFSDPSYFGKIFRREVGCSPREYRGRKRNALTPMSD